MGRESVLALIKKYQLQPRIQLGQNFLVDDRVIDATVTAAELTPKEDVVEIGPGLGVLTSALLNQAHAVYAYELDPDLVNVLAKEITSPKLHIIAGDVLATRWLWSKPRKIVANIPYNITTEILFKIFANAERILVAILMVQREVGERLLAKAGDSAFSKLTLTAQHFATISEVTKVSRTAFYPEPNVDSIIVKLELKPISYEISTPLLKFFALAFEQRRKTLFNNLKQHYSAELIKASFEALSINLKARPQEVDYALFAALFKRLN